MKRFAYNELLAWKNSPRRKPLIFEGARQVGKTWLLKEFAKNEYKNFVYLSLENSEQMRNLFADYDIPRIVRGISALTKGPIEKQNTLIILDEIQEVPHALSSLKYFYENAPEYHVAAAGSLLGISLHEGESFPVGKVNSINLLPMSFEEFLLALGKDALYEILHSRNWKEICLLKNEFIEDLRMYYFTGGMPEVVQFFAETQNVIETRQIQNRILNDYINDISKHAPPQEVQKITLVWKSIPEHLSKENKKFIFGALKKGARAKEYENAIQWLVNAGLAYKVTRVKKAGMPLNFYQENEVFKLFMHDSGLFGALSNTPPELILIGSKAFEEYKGAFTEQFVFQQLKTVPSMDIHYFSNNDSTLEIDFLIQFGAKIIPVEVKAEENLQSKSLKSFLAKYPESRGLRFSMSDYREEERFTNVPLYCIPEFFAKT